MSCQASSGIWAIVERILVLAVTVMDQAMRCRFNVSISFQDQNPESARTVIGPPAAGRRTIAASSSTKRTTPRKDPAEPLRILENTISAVSAGSDKWVIAELAGVAVGGALLAMSVHFADRRVQIDHQRCVAGPAPSSHARSSSRAATASSWRTYPNVNDRRNVPIVDGAITLNGNTACVAPARTTST